MLQKQSLKDQIVQLILEKIKTGEFVPGQRLKELSLAREFGTSQAPVREALRSLETAGFIEHKPNIGSSLKQLTLHEIKEIAEILEALESYILSASFTKIQENISFLIHKMEHFDQESQAEQPVIYYELFHQTIINSAENQSLLKLWQSLSIQLQSGLKNMNLSYSLGSLYIQIIEAIEHGNEKEALKTFHQYYRSLLDNSKL